MQSQRIPNCCKPTRPNSRGRFLAFGFTTLVDVNSAEEDRTRFIAAPVHPNLYHCGSAVHVLGGLRSAPAAQGCSRCQLPPTLSIRFPKLKSGLRFSIPATTHRPATWIARPRPGGVCVKVFVEPGFGGVFHWPVPSAETLAAFSRGDPPGAASS